MMRLQPFVEKHWEKHWTVHVSSQITNQSSPFLFETQSQQCAAQTDSSVVRTRSFDHPILAQISIRGN